MLTAIMEDISEDTVMAAMVTILERDLPKLMPILSSSDTTHTEMDMLSQLMPCGYHLIGKRSAEAESKPYYGYGGLYGGYGYGGYAYRKITIPKMENRRTD